MPHRTYYPEPRVSKFLFASKFMAPVWAVVRIYLGWQWLTAGWGKIRSPAWVGENAGAAVRGFLQGALERAAGDRPDVPGWYAALIENVFLPNATLFSYLVAWGEVLVGVALLLGFLTGVSAFVGGLMNVTFLLAGTVSSNPVMFVLATWVVLAWRVAGYYGLDYWILPALGAPRGEFDRRPGGRGGSGPERVRGGTPGFPSDGSGGRSESGAGEHGGRARRGGGSGGNTGRARDGGGSSRSTVGGPARVMALLGTALRVARASATGRGS